MDGVTTAMVGFIFLSLAFPHLVKNKTYLYVGLMSVLIIILMDGLAHAVGAASFDKFTYFMAALFQIIGVLMLVMSAGGLTPGMLGAEVTDAIEVVRRGETRNVIVPLSEDAKRKRDPMPTPSPRQRAEKEPEAFKIEDVGARPVEPPASNASGPLPLD